MKQKLISIVVATIAIMALSGGSIYAADWYVDQSVSGSGNGTSWEEAFETITEAVDVAGEGDNIHVAAGTYKEMPSTPNEQEAYGQTLLIRKIVSLYGGYPPGGGSREPSANETIIQGDPTGIYITSVYPSIGGVRVVNGFTFSESRYHGIVVSTTLSPVVIKNCIIKNNRSHGIYAPYTRKLLVSDCIIKNNNIGIETFYTLGGKEDFTIIQKSVIAENLTTGIKIGEYAKIRIQNSTISNNLGAGIRFDYDYSTANHKIINSIISGNEYGFYAARPPYWGPIDESYNDVWGNRVANYGGYASEFSPGEGTISENPKFIGSEPFDYHLQFDSPCIDAGIDIGLPFYGSAPDMGVYEYIPPPVIISKLKTNKSGYQLGQKVKIDVEVENVTISPEENLTLATTITNPNNVIVFEQTEIIDVLNGGEKRGYKYNYDIPVDAVSGTYEVISVLVQDGQQMDKQSTSFNAGMPTITKFWTNKDIYILGALVEIKAKVENFSSDTTYNLILTTEIFNPENTLVKTDQEIFVLGPQEAMDKVIGFDTTGQLYGPYSAKSILADVESGEEYDHAQLSFFVAPAEIDKIKTKDINGKKQDTFVQGETAVVEVGTKKIVDITEPVTNLVLGVEIVDPDEKTVHTDSDIFDILEGENKHKSTTNYAIPQDATLGVYTINTTLSQGSVLLHTKQSSFIVTGKLGITELKLVKSQYTQEELQGSLKLQLKIKNYDNIDHYARVVINLEDPQGEQAILYDETMMIKAGKKKVIAKLKFSIPDAIIGKYKLTVTVSDETNKIWDEKVATFNVIGS
jgi:hypothetical protein